MTSFSDLLQQGIANAWLFVPSAILLGALHGLEPGHSKTMMAAFIVAIRGTAMQAVLLGLAATASHTLVVWAVVLGGLYLWQGVDAQEIEPYFQLASAVLIVAIAIWMLWRTWVDQKRTMAAIGSGSRHGHGHGSDLHRIETGHGTISVEVFEASVPPRWRIRSESGQAWLPDEVTIVTERPDGARQQFSFMYRGEFLESLEEIPKPHEFMARVSLGHGSHTHDYDLSFVEEHGHKHGHMQEQARGLKISTDGYQDAHELAHANDIRRKFSDRTVTNWQIMMFGLTGGLIPCPAAITVLLICLQIKQLSLGFALVLCFSIGLAVTLVAVGAAAAVSVRHAERRWSGFSAIARRAPYLSGFLIIAVGIYVGMHGWYGIAARLAAT